jgi:hypothetical protein
MDDDIAKRLPPKHAVAFAWAYAELKLVEHRYPAEAHMLRRELLVERALSPSPRSKGIIERGGYKEVDRKSMPLWNDDERSEAGLEPSDYDDEKGKLLFEMAQNGDVDADAALCHIAFKHLVCGRELPINLKVFVMLLLSERFEAPPKRGRGRYSRNQNVIRDFVIVELVSTMKEFGFHPTRTRARHRSNDKEESGCSIVAKALAQLGIHMDEIGIEEVWSKRADLRL